MVRLKDLHRPVFLSNQIYFNSTMVRLKDNLVAKNTGEILFQFHYGTIKRVCFLLPVLAYHLFQFHYGTIKSG